MDTAFSYRVDGKSRQWGGNNSPQDDRHNRRRQKLQALLQSLKAGDLDGSRLAYTELINFDPSLSGDTYLSKIGTAVQRQDGVPMSKRKGLLDFYPGSARIDFSA